MWMLRRFGHRQDRRDARGGAAEDPLPMRARLRGEPVREQRLENRPVGLVGAIGEVGAGNAQPIEQRGIELRFERADRDVLAVAGRVGGLAGMRAVEPVFAAAIQIGRASLRERGGAYGWIAA